MRDNEIRWHVEYWQWEEERDGWTQIPDSREKKERQLVVKMLSFKMFEIQITNCDEMRGAPTLLLMFLLSSDIYLISFPLPPFSTFPFLF